MVTTKVMNEDEVGVVILNELRTELIGISDD